MTVYKITQKWKKVLERQPRPVTLLITFPGTGPNYLFVQLGKGEPDYQDADIEWLSGISGTAITLTIPPNTPVYAKVFWTELNISCTIIKEMEEE